MILGIDFDNTLANYDNVFYATALESSLIPLDTEKNKKDIRDKIRQLPDGEIKWQKLQAYIYGKGMKDSQVFEGVERFFKACREREINVSIISHKTEFAPVGEDGVNLRDTAIDWMRQKRFFDHDGFGLQPEWVYFESTRREKIDRIKQLECTHFVDDLEETFLEATFPDHVEKILYSKGRADLKGVTVCNTWKEIYDYFFEK